MADVRIEINQAGFKELALGDELRAACFAEVERARVIAEGLAAEFTKTGEYERSFNTFTQVVETGERFPHHSVAGVLKNDSPHAAAVEWGNRDNGGTDHHTLGRTLDLLHG